HEKWPAHAWPAKPIGFQSPLPNLKSPPMIGSLLQADFEEIIADKDWDGLRDALSELDSADIAELIIDLPSEVEGIIFRVLPRERAADVFEHLPIDYQQQLIQSLSGPEVKSILNDM